jgi:hypothetical protein
MISKTKSNIISAWRKWFGIIWLVIELNLCSANIFGFSALFKVLPNYGVYSDYCQSSSNAINSTEQDCTGQLKQYQVDDPVVKV